MPDYTGDLQHCADTDGAKGAELAHEVHRQRAIQYLNRVKGETSRPIGVRKRRRLKSMQWGLALDSCLMYATNHGLDFYGIANTKRRNVPAHMWPSLVVVPDQG